ncbi:MAG: hypothetical protein ACRD44_10090 [Bryobacteraceae bacterium]
MRSRLALLNLVLLALLAGAIQQIRAKYFAARERETHVLGRIVAAAAVAPEPVRGTLQPAVPSGYLEVAEKLLFSRDRNPVVVVETTPPKPMPALPSAHGVLDLGSGPTVILAEKPGAMQRGYVAGERVGEFTLVSVSAAEIVFDWEGTEIRKSVDELVDRRAVEAAAVAPPSPAPQAQSQTVSAAKSSLIESPGAQQGPGVPLGGDQFGCRAGDSSPSGTVISGYKKVVVPTPFGNTCRWEPAR